MELFGYLAAIIMGFSLGLVGGGGSILTVPILVYLFGQTPMVATGYSLFIVGLTSLVGGAFYLKRAEVDIKIGLIFAGPSFVGVYLTRAYLVPWLPDPVISFATISISKPVFIMGVFAVIMLAAAFSMIRGSKNNKELKAQQSSSRGKFKISTLALIGLEGLVVGGVTGFVGAGGGFLIIPALVVLVGLPMKIAVGTSLFIISIKSLFGFLGDVKNLSNIDWQLLLVLSLISVGGLFVGVQLSSKVPERVLKKGFGVFVLLMGLFVLGDQLLSLKERRVGGANHSKRIEFLRSLSAARAQSAASLGSQKSEQTEIGIEDFKRVCAPIGVALKNWAAMNQLDAQQISLKARNPNHQAKSQQDIDALTELESNQSLTDLSEGEILYVPIRVTQGCLHCHGEKNLRPAFIQKNYPQDLAWGYQVGQLRGAFKVSQALR